MKRRVLGALVFIMTIAALSLHVEAAQKVTLTPTGTTLAETQSTAVSVVLDEPIVGPGPDAPYFNLNITSSDPSRVAIDPNPVEYTSAEWSQTKVFVVTALHDNTFNTSNTVTISFVVDSDSEFYDGFSGSFVLSIVDIDPAPATTVQNSESTPTTAPVATLAETGQNTLWIKAASLSILILGAILLRKTMRSTH